MDYFWIRQDKRYHNTPVIQDFYSKFKRKDFIEDNANRLPEKNVVFTDSPVALDYLDILDSQMFSVSQSVRDIFKMYEPTTKFKEFCYLNNNLNAYMRYFTPVLKSAACINRYVNHIPYLKKETIEDYSIIRIDNADKDMVIIGLDVAESLLRRSIRKFELVKVNWD